MARRVVWTRLATADLLQILDYWEARLHSKNYSRRLARDFQKAVGLIAAYPSIGSRVEGVEELCFVKGPYQIFYHASGDAVQILRIWDARRDPESFVMR